jgi:hypothetical protein
MRYRGWNRLQAVATNEQFFVLSRTGVSGHVATLTRSGNLAAGPFISIEDQDGSFTALAVPFNSARKRETTREDM